MKSIFITLFVLLSVQLIAQVKVEDIKADSDMNKFMEACYFKGTKRDTVVRYGIVTSYYDTSFALSYDSNFIRSLEAYKSSKWIKADLNKDGKMDLLLSVSFNESSKVLAFISKDSTYDVQKLSLDNNQYGQYFIKYDTGKGNIIMGVADPDISDNGEMSADSSSRTRIDTLTYKDGLFVDYDMGDKPLDTIDTFRISFSGSFPSAYGTQRIMIPRIGNVEFTRPGVDSSTGADVIQLFKMDWNKSTKDSFFAFADRLNLSNYKDKYNPLWKVSYGSIIRTEVVFDDKTCKKIKDHGDVVPIGLLHLYDIVNKLKETDNWIYVGPYKGPIVIE
jgi:hypothetical protein